MSAVCQRRKGHRKALRIERLENRLLLTLAPGGDDSWGISSGHGGVCSCPFCTGVGLDEIPPAQIDTNGIAEASLSSLPQLESNPSAAAKLFLDFDGHFEASWGGYANVNTPAFDKDGDVTTFSAGELTSIYEIWARVAEDYAPFNINVTTVDPGIQTNRVVAVIAIGGSWADWYGSSAGGVAFIGGFFNSSPNVGYVFENNLSNNNKFVAEATAHEAGHLFGLQHQALWNGSNLVTPYNSGNGSWAPLMGLGYNAVRTTWHNGPTPSGPAAFQDDMAILAGASNNFGYKSDDYGGTTATASSLPLSGISANFSGLIRQTNDVDVWSFTTIGGIANFQLIGAQFGANLNAVLELWDSSGATIASDAPSNSLGASLTTSLGAGTYYLAARSAGDYGNVGQYTITGTLPALPVPTVSIAKLVDGAEPGFAGTFRVTQTLVSPTDTVVTYSIGGTATAGSDYTTLSGTVTILAGQTTADINVAALNDSLVEASETVVVTLTGFSSASPDVVLDPLGTQRAATVNLNDNDSATVSIAKLVDGAEPGPAGTFRVTQTLASSTDTVVNYSIGGTATSGNDYTALSGTLTILAGQTTADINVAALNDSLVEANETVVVTLTGLGIHDPDLALDPLASARTATVNLADNDTATVSVTKVVDGAEPGTAGTFRVTQSLASTTDTMVNYSIGGTATAASDYSALSGTATILAGQTTADVIVSVVNDSLVEATETVVVTLTGLGTHDPDVSLDLLASQATLNLSDNDTATFTIDDVTISEGSGTLTFYVSLSNPIAVLAQLDVSFADVSTSSGDFTHATQTVTFAAGSTTSQAVTVPVSDDALMEATETFTASLALNSTTPLSAYATSLTDTATGTIQDDETTTVSIAKLVDGAEPETSGTIRVTQTLAGTTDTILMYSIGGTATSGSDYTALSGTVTILAGHTTADINVAALDDGLVETSETVVVTLTGLVSADPDVTLDPLASQRTVTLNLADNDSATVSIAKLSDGGEPVTAGAFRVTQTLASTTDTVVTYSIGGTATAGSDYPALSGTVTILAGQTTADISVAVQNDNLVEAIEVVMVTLTGLGTHDPDVALDPLASQRTATVNLADNDSATVSIAKLVDGAEPGTAAAFRLIQTLASSSDTVVTYSIGGTAAAGSDYSALSGTVTILAGQTTADINVAVLNDNLVEAAETVLVTLTGLGSHDPEVTLDPLASQATVNLADNDAATVSITTLLDGAEPLTEGTFRVTQTLASTTDTVVTYSIGGTATSGSDYTALSGTVTILAGQTMADINVAVLNDNLVEASESVVVALTEILSADTDITLDVLASQDAVNLVDDDGATVSIGKLVDGAEPGTAGTFRVTQALASTTDTVVNYSIGGTATAASDYSALSGSVTILAGQTTADITVLALNDNLVEASETVVVALTGFVSADPDITLDPLDLQATVNIADNDSAAVSIAKLLDGAEPGTAGTFRVTQTLVSVTDTVVAYSIGGAATAGNDYTALSGTVTILAGQTTADINVAVLNDSLVEAAETVLVTLTGLGSHDPEVTLDPLGLTATVNITDNDSATVSIAKLADGAEPGTAGTFRVTQTLVSTTDTVVNYSIGGTATVGSDYTALSGTVTILAGQTTANLIVAVLNDSLVEATETVIVTLSGLGTHDPEVTLDPSPPQLNAVVLLADDDTATYTIDEDSSLTLPAEAGGLGAATYTLVSGPAHGSLSGILPNVTYSPSANYNGGDSFTYQTTIGTNDPILTTVVFVINPINDAPSATLGPNLIVKDEDPSQSIVSWADPATGPTSAVDEIEQQPTLFVTNDNHSLFMEQPSIDEAGMLTFRPAPNVQGIAVVTVVIKDDGGTANGGVDQSVPLTFNIVVEKPQIWHNASLWLDVDGDGNVTASDALDVINFLNAVGARPVPSNATGGPPYYDVDGDGFVSAVDALHIINYINAFGPDGVGPDGEGEPQVGQPVVPPSTMEGALPSTGQLEFEALITLLAQDVAPQPRRRR